METSSAGQHSADKTQVLLGAEQDRLKEEARKISQTVEQLREKLRKVIRFCLPAWIRLDNISYFSDQERSFLNDKVSGKYFPLKYFPSYSGRWRRRRGRWPSW